MRIPLITIVHSAAFVFVDKAKRRSHFRLGLDNGSAFFVYTIMPESKNFAEVVNKSLDFRDNAIDQATNTGKSLAQGSIFPSFTDAKQGRKEVCDILRGYIITGDAIPHPGNDLSTQVDKYRGRRAQSCKQLFEQLLRIREEFRQSVQDAVKDP